MKYFISSLLILCFCGVACASSFFIAGRDIAIPTPEGFTVATVEMLPFYVTLLEGIPESSEFITGFVPTKYATELAKRHLPPSKRFCYASVRTRGKNEIISVEKFMEMQEGIKSYSLMMAERFAKRTKGKSGNEKPPMAWLYGTDNACASFGFFEANGRDLAERVSQRAYYEVITTVHISGKMVFFFTRAPVDEAEWANKISLAWARAILKSNGLSTNQLPNSIK